MGHVALEIPLAAFPLARRRQRDGAADARIEPLGDALDDAALAGRVAPFEDDDEFQFLGDHPVLQLDQLALQAQELLEIEVAREGALLGQLVAVRQEVGEVGVFELELQVLVEVVLDLGVDALLHHAGSAVLDPVHDRAIPRKQMHDLRSVGAKCQRSE